MSQKKRVLKGFVTQNSFFELFESFFDSRGDKVTFFKSCMHFITVSNPQIFV